MTRRVVLAMSGGVDSSASAVLLQQQGYEVIGLFMRSGAVEEQVCKTDTPTAVGTAAPSLPIVTTKSHRQGCCSATDAADAQRVADRLDIPFHALNFRDAFGRIQDYFVDEYLAGRTPNPCVQCNVWLKFGKLWEFAQQVGASHIATGHYARIDRTAGVPRLQRGLDLAKDQSYVLFGIRPEVLDHILFPVGEYTKPQIRELAEQAGLRVAHKPDSYEICFVPDNDYAAYMERRRELPDMAGDFVDAQGNFLGQHTGYHHYTIGQRRGLGVTFGEPRFVIRIEPATRRVVLGTKDELGAPGLVADQLNWFGEVALPQRVRAQIRSQHPAAPALAELNEQGNLVVRFDEPQLGVAPGQAVVLYDERDVVLGGGWIQAALPHQAATLSVRAAAFPASS